MLITESLKWKVRFQSTKLDGRTEETKSKTKTCSSPLPHPRLLIHQTQTHVCSKDMLEECKCIKLAKRNAKSMAELLHELSRAAMQTVLPLCYHNKLTDFETLNITNKTFQSKATEKMGFFIK